MGYDKYVSPLSERYASKEMQYIFSPDMKFKTWRKLWIALAETEKELGLNITDEQIAELKEHAEDINYDVAKAREKVVRHDVMSHVYAYGQQCPKAKGIIHLGATSCYVGDNTDIIIMAEALKLVKKKLVNVLDELSKFADQYKDLPTLAFTHFQPAQPTTVGKRATLWMQEFSMDLADLDYVLGSLKLLGSKGTTGTQASFLELFEGDQETIDKIDPMIAKKMGFEACYPVSGQTKAMGSIKGELRGFRRFASFMYDRFPEVKHFTEISRDMIEDYLVYIKTDTGLTSVSYTTELSVLDNLLDEIGRELEIENICNLFLSSDCRAYDNALPEAYSDAEIRRFNCALTKLKPQLGRCLIIHQMLGTRIEDTLTLRRDCLSEKSGHYFITIIQQKTRKYKRPVSDQLAELIRKAIEVSEKEHPDSEYIFLQDNGKLYTDSMLKYHVNIMIYENDIRDDNGNYFEFRTHRFRHTFGVKLTEMKLDDDSIARLLGHKDTRTIPHYRRLRNEALAEDTKAVRDEMNELLAQYRREKENAETR